MLAPPQSMHLLLMRLCSKMLVPPQNLHWFLWRLCSIFLRPLRGCGALIRCPGGRGRRFENSLGAAEGGRAAEDSLRTKQARARSSSASLPGAGAADAGMSFSGSDMA